MMSILQSIQASIINDDDKFERLKGSTNPSSTFYSSPIISSTNIYESSSLQLSSRKLIHNALTSATTTFKHSATFSEIKKVTDLGISAKKMSPISTLSSLHPLSKEKMMPTMFLSKSVIVSSIPVSTDVTLHVTVTKGPKLIINTFSSSGHNSRVTLPTEITTASFSSSRLSSSETLPKEFTTANFSSSRPSSNVALSTELNTASISSSRQGSTIALSTSSQFSSNVTLPTKFITDSDTSTLTVSGLSTKRSTHFFQKTTIDTEEPEINITLGSLSSVTFSSSLSLSDVTLSSEIKHELSTSKNIFKDKTVFVGSSVSDLSRTSTFITKLLQSSQFWTTRQPTIPDNLSTQQKSSLSNKPDISVTQSTDTDTSSILVTTARTGQITTDKTVSSTETPSERQQKRDSSTFSESASTITGQTKINFSTEAVSASSTPTFDGSTCLNIPDSHVSPLPERSTTPFVASTTLSYETTKLKVDETISTTEFATHVDTKFISLTQQYTTTASLFLSTRVAENTASSFIPDTSSIRLVTISTGAKDAKTIQPFSETVYNFSPFYSTSIGPYQITTDRTLSSAELTSESVTKHDYSTSFTESISIITGLPTQEPYSTNDTLISVESTSLDFNASSLITQSTDAELSSPPKENSTSPFVLSTTFSNGITTLQLEETNSTTQSATGTDLKSTYVRQKFESTSTESALLSTKNTDYVGTSFIPDINLTGFTTSPTGAVKSETSSLQPYTEKTSNYPHLYSSSIKSDPVTSDKDVSSAVSTSKTPTNGEDFTTFTESATIVSALYSKMTFSTNAAFPPSTSISVESTSSNVNASLRVSNKTDTATSSLLPEISTSPFVASTSFFSETTITALNETITEPIETKSTSSTKVFDSTSTDSVFISEVTDQVASSFIPDTSPIDFETSHTVAVKSETSSLQPYTVTISNYSTLSSAVSTSKRPTNGEDFTKFTESASIVSALPSKISFSTNAAFPPSTSISVESTSSNVNASLRVSNKTDTATSSLLPEISTNPFVASTLFSSETSITALNETITEPTETKSTLSIKVLDSTSTDSVFISEVTDQVASSSIPDTSPIGFETSHTVAVKSETPSLQPYTETISNYSTLYSSSIRSWQITSEKDVSSAVSTSKRYSKHKFSTLLTESVSVITGLPTQVPYSTNVRFLNTTSISVKSTSLDFNASSLITQITDADLSSPPKENSTSPFVLSTTFYNEITTLELKETNSTTQSGTGTDLKSTSVRQKFESTSTESALLTTMITYYVGSSLIPDINPTGFTTSPTGAVKSETSSLQPYTEKISNYSHLYSSSVKSDPITSDKDVSSAVSTSKTPTNGEDFTTFTESASIVSALYSKMTFSTNAAFPPSTSISVESTSSNVNVSLRVSNKTDTATSPLLPEISTSPLVASTSFSSETTITEFNETITEPTETKSTSSVKVFDSTSTDSVFISEVTDQVASSFNPDTSPIVFETSHTVSVKSETPSLQPYTETVSNYSTIYSSSIRSWQITSEKDVSSAVSTSKTSSKHKFSTLLTESVSIKTAFPTKVYVSTKTEPASSTSLPFGITSSHISTSDSNISFSLPGRSKTSVAPTPLSDESAATKLIKTFSTIQSGTQINTKSTFLTKISEYSSTDSESTEVTDYVASSMKPETSPIPFVTSSVVAVENHITTLQPFSESVVYNISLHSSSISPAQITSDRAVSSAESTSKEFTKHEILTTFKDSVSVITALPTRDIVSSEAGFLSTTSISVEGTSSHVKTFLPFTNATDSSISYPLPENSTNYFVASTTLSNETKTKTTEQNKTISTTQSYLRTDTETSISSQKFELTSTNSVFASMRVTDHFSTSFIPDTNPTRFDTSSTGTVERDTTTTQLFSEAISNSSLLYSSSIRPGQITSDQAVSTTEATLIRHRTVEISTTFTESFSVITALPTKKTFSSKTESATSSSVSVRKTSSNTSTYLPFTTDSKRESASSVSISSGRTNLYTSTSLLSTNTSDPNISSFLQEKSTTPCVAAETLSNDATTTKVNKTFPSTQSGTSINTESISLTKISEYSSTVSKFISTKVTDNITLSRILDSSPTPIVTSSVAAVENHTTLVQPFSESILKKSSFYSSTAMYEWGTSDSTVSSAESTSNKPTKYELLTTFTESVFIKTGQTTMTSFPSKARISSTTSISVEGTSSNVTKSFPVTDHSDLSTSYPLSQKSTTNFVESTALPFDTKTTTIKQKETISTEAGFSSTTSVSAKSTSLNVTTPLPFANVTDSGISYPQPEKSTTNFVESTTLSYETTTPERNKIISRTQSQSHTDTTSYISSQKFEPTPTDFVFLSTRVTDHFSSSFIPDTNPSSLVTSSVGTVERHTTTRQVFSDASSNPSLLFSSSIMPRQITSDQDVTPAGSTSKRATPVEMSTIFSESVSILTSLPTQEPYSTKARFLSSTSLSVENTSSTVTESLPVSSRTAAKLSSHLPERSKVSFVASTTISYEITSTILTEMNKTVSTAKSSSRNDTLSTSSKQTFDSISTDPALLSTKVTDYVTLSFIPDTSPIDFIKSSSKTVGNDSATIQPFSESISNSSPLNLSSIMSGQLTTDKAVSSADSISKRPTKQELSTIYTEPVSVVTVSIVTTKPALVPYSTEVLVRSSTIISVENTSLNVKASLPVTRMPEYHISSPRSKGKSTPLVASTATSHEKTNKHDETSFAPTISYETSTSTSKYNDSISTTQASTRNHTISNFASKSMEFSSTSQTYTNITILPTTTSTLTTLTTTYTKASSPKVVRSETTSFQLSSSSQIEANSSIRTFRSSTSFFSQTTRLPFISKYFVRSTATANLMTSVSGKTTGNNKTESSPSIQETTTIVEKTHSVRYNNTSNMSTTEISKGKPAFKSTLSALLTTLIFYNTTDFVNSSATTISRRKNGKSSTSKETVFSTNSISSASTVPYTYSTVGNTFNLLSSIKPSNDSTESTSSYDLSSLATSFPELTASTFIPKYSNFMSISTEPEPTSNVEILTTSDQLPGSIYTCNVNENCCENRVHGHIVIIASVIQGHKATTDQASQPVTKSKPSTSASTSVTTKPPIVPTETKPTNKKECHKNRLKGQLVVVASVNQKDSCND